MPVTHEGAGARPTFLKKADIARELSIGETTLDDWIADGTIPPAHIAKGAVRRWHWPTIEAMFAPKPATVVDLDPYIVGARNATKGLRRGNA